MSDVEIFWNRASQYFHSPRTWQELDPIEQMQVVQALNTILHLMNLK